MVVSISPRANETAAVAAVLEDDTHPDAESMAKAVVRALGAELAKRDAYLIVVPDGAFCYGPYFTEAQAVKAWTTQVGPATGGQARIVRSFAWGETEAGTATAGTCVCGHQPEQHRVKPLRGGKMSAPMECGACAASVRKGAENRCPQYERRT